MRRMSILLLVVLATVHTACSLLRRPQPRYGREYNAQRMKVGLPIIPEDWELYRVDAGFCVWVNPEREEKYKSRVPVHYSKTVNYRTGSLLSESDVYEGSLDYTTVDGTFREGLSITYHFQVDDHDYRRIVGWSAMLSDAHGTTDITLEEADRILAERGIKRLSYDFPPQE